MKLGEGPTPFSLIAFDEGRSIYDAPTIAVFVALSALVTMGAVHLLASKRTRRSPAWDCGFPDPSPATQYTASSFSQPLRRVYGGIVFRAAETRICPLPATFGPGAFAVRFSDYLWRYLYPAPAEALWSSPSNSIVPFSYDPPLPRPDVLHAHHASIITATWM